MSALRAFIVIGLSVLFFIITAPSMFQTPPIFYAGLHLVKTGALVQPNIVRVDKNSPAYKAGVRDGDSLGCMSVRDNALLIGSGAGFPAGYVPGTPLQFCDRHASQVHTLRLIGDARPPIGLWYGSVWIAALRLAVFAIFLLSGIALVMGRPSVMSWAFFGYCLGSAPTAALGVYGTTLAPAIYVMGLLPTLMAGSAAVGLLLVFALTVPDDRVASGWRLPAYWIALGLSVALAAWTAFTYLNTSLYFSLAISDTVDQVFTALTVVVVLIRVAGMQAQDRARFGWAAFAIIWGVISNALRNATAFQQADLKIFGIIAAFATCVMPVALMYAILRRHIIDVRFVISRAVVYTVITTLVVGIIGAVDWAASVYLHQTRIAMALSAAVTIGIGFVLHRTYGWLEHAVDVVLYRNKHEAEAYLMRLGKTLLRADKEETVDRALVHDPYDKFDLTMAGLFRAQGSTFVASCSAGSVKGTAIALEREHDLVRFLVTERSKLHITDLRKHVADEFEEFDSSPAVAIPIFLGDELAAFAVYGIHRDGTKLDPDEIETLERLCETAAQAYIRIENLRFKAFSQQTLQPA